MEMFYQIAKKKRVNFAGSTPWLASSFVISCIDKADPMALATWQRRLIRGREAGQSRGEHLRWVISKRIAPQRNNRTWNARTKLGI